MEALRLQAGADQVRRMVGQRRDRQMRADPAVQLVEDWPGHELRFQRAESGFQFGQFPVRPQDRLGVPVGPRRAQDAGAARLVRLGVVAAVLESDRDGVDSLFVVVDLDQVSAGPPSNASP